MDAITEAYFQRVEPVEGLLLYQTTDGDSAVFVRACGSRYKVYAKGSALINIVKDLSEARQLADDRLQSLIHLRRLRLKAMNRA